MKSLFKYLLTAIVLSVYSQKNPDLNIVDRLDFEVIKKADSTDITIKSDTITPIDIKAEYWNHTVYNPFKNELVMFPLQLEFKDSTYASPIGKNKVITSRYGWRRGRAHKGIDIDLITGDSLFAMFDGIVRMSRYSRGHGKTVVIRHYNGLETVYAHLSKYGAKENDSIKKGQYIGKGGVSGNARGSHLHLVINYKGISINPEYLFEFNETNSIRANEIWITQQWTRPYVHNSKRQSKITPLLSEEEAITSLKKQKKIYVVKRGDTLSRISKRNNVTIAAICKTNAISKNSVIKPGQKLVIEK
ncbi:peptidoglycan DD-metalloendopeptidase family protein [Psychroserpens ponticola]|uniref:Peptidoglycan DD-metalloendopeptidase family protein n=1 Tax=Psychroserpens ponticola TaxID=2932268 RepID=A0ABY7S1X2_9FLAO|nr:peptidoglycan DD-metalloendopeptidase family protein [Psychroserpens ponticola]WCO03133.1 peptidoglycan DD-metalloendopeptidase family protein [Psychroserpens ponticola]